MIYGIVTIGIAILIFLIGLFFSGVANGQSTCLLYKTDVITKQETNYNGGIAGIVIGVILFIIGIYVYIEFK